MPPTTAMPSRKARFERACASGSTSPCATFRITNEKTISECVITATGTVQTKSSPAPMITSDSPA